LANTFLWEYSDKRLKLAQLLGRLGVFLTNAAGSISRAADLRADTTLVEAVLAAAVRPVVRVVERPAVIAAEGDDAVVEQAAALQSEKFTRLAQYSRPTLRL
jgi:hypothetical protein